MLKVENVEVMGLPAAIRGMRNPMNSWDKSDSEWDGDRFIVGPKDIDLMHRLYVAGPEHRKFMRMIHVQMDITSNHFWWPEFDTYKVGTTRDSCSKMHKIHVKNFVPDDFSHEGISTLGGEYAEHFTETLRILEDLRQNFNQYHDKLYWRAMIETLPMGYNLRATVDFSYETAVNIIRQRSNHKLDEWHVLVDVLKGLPYMNEIMNGAENE